jgi:predicted phosphohydrolase
MNLQICSDIHLDQLESFKNQDLISPKGDVLILAGDICHGYNIEKYIDFFEYLSRNFQYVIYIPGNHEYYSNYNFDNNQNEIINIDNKIYNFLKIYNNIVYLNNKSVVIEDYLFSGSCLWCKPDVEPPPWFKISLKKDDILSLNNKSIEYINKVSSINHSNHIIITHYPPLYIDKEDKKKYDKYSKYYKNDNILLKNMPKYWIFGHNHKNFFKKINNTTYISNQRKDKNYLNSYSIFV